MTEDDQKKQLLSPGAQRFVDSVLGKLVDNRYPYIGAHIWLLSLLERHGAMAESIVEGLSADKARATAKEKITNGEIGPELAKDVLVTQAVIHARSRGLEIATEKDLAAVILSVSGFMVHSMVNMTPQQLNIENTTKPAIPAVRAFIPTPALDQFGRDLTRESRDGKLSPVVGREQEIDLVIETLCRRTKRNPILVGPAGVGKTAIVEGLAHRINQKKVPQFLQEARIVVLQPSILTAGASIAGELEKRMKAILDDARKDGIILFIDEIHTVMGAGGSLGTTDMGSMLKPVLARGEISCIAATTDDEFRRYIESDSALERRFQPIRVNELNSEQTIEVLKSLRVEINKDTLIEISDDILVWLVDFGKQYMRNRYFPDKAVDLMEQCYAHALATGRTSVEMADAIEVAQRMVGMPVVSIERLEGMQNELRARRLLTNEEINILSNRLQVTLRGLDMRASRPNAVILMAADAMESSTALGECIAETLFGSSERLISIDLSRFVTPEDINLLIGSPPGYVGYNDRLPLHELMQIPWCVLRLERIDVCHSRIREIIAQSIIDGWIMDGRGKTIYLSDAVIILTADISIEAHRGLGFIPERERFTADALFGTVANRIGDNLASQIDLFSFGMAEDEGVSTEWILNHFLNTVAGRYLKQGLKLTWKNSFLDWMSQQQSNHYSEHDWENWVDSQLTPSIIQYLPVLGWKTTVEVAVGFEEDKIQVTQAQQEE